MTRSRSGGAPTPDPVAGFAASIAHDYSNLLQTVQQAAELLRDELPEGDPRLDRLEQLMRAAEQATQLTRQLQAFGRAQMLRPDVVRPGEVVRSMAGMLRRVVLDDIGLDLAVSSTDDAVWFDAEQLRTLVFNLVTASADELASHGQLLLKVERDERGGSGCVAISVTANGVDGTTATTAAFGPRLSGTAARQGTDLRLASVEGLVSQSGGTVESAIDGRAITHRVLLPITDRPAAAAPAAGRTAFRVADELRGTEVVFVVEDDESVRDLVRASLERYGYSVYVASDGEEALRIADMFNASPDLLLTDLLMPGVTGSELVEQLSATGRLPRVLLMSGYPGEHARHDGTHSDHPFIQKPFTHAELARKVRDVLDTPR